MDSELVTRRQTVAYTLEAQSRAATSLTNFRVVCAAKLQRVRADRVNLIPCVEQNIVYITLYCNNAETFAHFDCNLQKILTDFVQIEIVFN